jgi:phage FluMu protein Com
MSPHIMEQDYTCERCGMLVEAFIPHECNPDICADCNGRKRVWDRGWVSCPRCKGTGLTQWGNEEDTMVLA